LKGDFEMGEIETLQRKKSEKNNEKTQVNSAEDELEKRRGK